AYLEEYKNSGYPAVSHSEQYKKHYAPSYRIISSDFALYFPVFKQIEKLLREKECIIVAIDGRSGSGKSFLAGLLQAVYGSPIISMDHFFLRPEQRTAQRLQEPGGNVDYERFKEEVTLRLREREAFNYRIYDCQTNTFTDSPLIIPHALTIVEGSYSHHPSLVEDYDLRVFLSVPVEVQRQRILRRNGAAMWERFENEWIPLEELYFSTLKIKEKSHIKLGVDSNGSQGSNT
ncbi:MAG: hypothetical protein GX971_00665, partial [Firmicutes bacterium]|nr:hypothetical protein [Bacillota bacterium]